MRAYATRPLPPSAVNEMSGIDPAPRSVLYLLIEAKAGYYTPDRRRMESPDPVEVEISMYAQCASGSYNNAKASPGSLPLERPSRVPAARWSHGRFGGSCSVLGERATVCSSEEDQSGRWPTGQQEEPLDRGPPVALGRVRIWLAVGWHILGSRSECISQSLRMSARNGQAAVLECIKAPWMLHRKYARDGCYYMDSRDLTIYSCTFSGLSISTSFP
jgi:hypothetical protein